MRGNTDKFVAYVVITLFSGVFRLLPRDVPRSDIDVLNAANTIYHECTSLNAFLNRCADAAIFRKGDRLIRRRGGAAGGDQDDEEQQDTARWHRAW